MKYCAVCQIRMPAEETNCTQCGGPLRSVGAGTAAAEHQSPASQTKNRTPPDAPSQKQAAQPFDVINDLIPDTHRHLLMPDENAFHFEWMDSKGGCGTTQSAKQFMLITDRRILYEATIKGADGANAKYVQTSGSIPLSKISFIGTSSISGGCDEGCNSRRTHLLKVNSGGGSIEFPFFSRKKVMRIQRGIAELISNR